MLPVAWAVCVDVGREAAGTISGAMNTAGQFGAVVMSIGYGMLVDTYGWNLPLALIACSCFLSVICWFNIDPSQICIACRETEAITSPCGPGLRNDPSLPGLPARSMADSASKSSGRRTAAHPR